MEVFIEAKNEEELEEKWFDADHGKPKFCEVISVEDEDYNLVDIDI